MSVRSATSSAWPSVVRKAAASVMTWSAGNTAITACGALAAMRSAASAIAAAVFRACGSTSTFRRGRPARLAADAAACAAPVTTSVRARGTSGASRASVSARSVRRPAIGSSCFGTRARLRGQNRVPDPPAITTA